MVGITDRPDITSAVYKGRQVNPDQEKCVWYNGPSRHNLSVFTKAVRLTMPRKSVVGITDCPDITSAVNKGRRVNSAQEKCGWYNGPSRHNLSCLQRPTG